MRERSLQVSKCLPEEVGNTLICDQIAQCPRNLSCQSQGVTPPTNVTRFDAVTMKKDHCGVGDGAKHRVKAEMD